MIGDPYIKNLKAPTEKQCKEIKVGKTTVEIQQLENVLFFNIFSIHFYEVCFLVLILSVAQKVTVTKRELKPEDGYENTTKKQTNSSARPHVRFTFWYISSPFSP